MKKRIYYFGLFLFLSFILPAEAFEGFVKGDLGEAVPDCLITVLETDELAISDENGYYIFPELPEGNWTLYFMAPGYDELFEEIIVPGEQPHSSLMISQVVEMEEISVKEKRNTPEAAAQSKITAEEIVALPTGGDPFNSVAKDPGIVSEDISPGSFGYRVRRGSLPSGGLRNSDNNFSVYGANSDFNTYAYDYMRIPTNKHSYGLPTPPSIIVPEALDSIGIYKGTIPLNYGSGIGGMFRAVPDNEFDFQTIIQPSIMDVSAQQTIPFDEENGTALYIRHSIAHWTVIPLLQNEIKNADLDKFQTEFLYGDFLSHTQTALGDGLLNIDVLGYYDWVLMDMLEDDPDLAQLYASAKMTSVPAYLSGGSKWTMPLDGGDTISVNAYGSTYRKPQRIDMEIRADNEDQESELQAKYHYDLFGQVNTGNGGIEYSRYLDSGAILNMGGDLRYAYATASHEQTVYIYSKNPQFDDEGNPVLDDEGNQVFELEEEEENEKPLSVTEEIWRSHFYGTIEQSWGDLNVKGGAGGMWLPLQQAIRPSLEGEFSLPMGESFAYSFRLGWSPGYYDELTYISRVLDETRLETESKTDLSQPPMAVCLSQDLSFKPAKNQEIKLTPYGAWYYDLSGLALDSAYSSTLAENENDLYALYPEYGYSIGSDIEYSARWFDHFLTNISYTISETKYHSDTENFWFYSNNDIRHQIKLSLMRVNKQFSFGLSGSAYIDMPFTPEKVVVDEETGELKQVKEEFNSARDLSPQYEGGLNLKLKIPIKKVELQFFADSFNFLSILNRSLYGLTDEASQVEGSSSSEVENRRYSDIDPYNWMNLLETQIGFRLSF